MSGKKITRKNGKNHMKNKRKTSRNLTTKNKKMRKQTSYSKKHAKHKKQLSQKKNRRRRRNTMRNKNRRQKGGVQTWESNYNMSVPYKPNGGPYQPGSSTNGLNGGYYYGLSKDIHGNRNWYEPNNKMNFTESSGKVGNIKQSGGGILPQDIVDLGRNIVYGGKSIYSGIVGENMSVSSNPNPTSQNLKIGSKNVMSTDLQKIFKDSALKVSNM
jgi:hypothetical protein